MSDYSDKAGGTLFPNRRKQQPNHPDLTGSLVITEHMPPGEYWLSAWTKTGKGGGKFLSLSAPRRKDAAPAKQQTAAQSQQPVDDVDIPF